MIIFLIYILSVFYLFSVSLWRKANAQNVKLYTIHIDSKPTLLYFDLYLHTAYAGHYV